ncbi:polygalacturonase ADPG2 [Beta vulgaris subsp. vulgaris]|uniref:polygalacturonase ADPG2 n=1 Tax=Beta vulgaris subsp. vulgaris TaxID=3555 RepID=UPI002548F1EB|nr:polygalacturonase ADPG2 [Beta vulgaris subsp. vulgaris]
MLLLPSFRYGELKTLFLFEQAFKFYELASDSSVDQALTIDSSSAIRVRGLIIQNSQQMHFVIARSVSVRVSNVLISSPGDSPNTDGINISESMNVVLLDCKIGIGIFNLDLLYSYTLLLP